MRTLWMLGLIVAGAISAGCCGGGSKTDESSSAPMVVGGANWVKVSKKAGLQDQVKAEVAKARSKKVKPIVYVGATWCEPCRAIHTYQRDPKMVDAFAGTYVIELDMDDWGERSLREMGYETSAIPVFISVDDEGKAKGPKIDGGAWGDNIPENMAPPLKTFFEGIS